MAKQLFHIYCSLEIMQSIAINATLYDYQKKPKGMLPKNEILRKENHMKTSEYIFTEIESQLIAQTSDPSPVIYGFQQDMKLHTLNQEPLKIRMVHSGLTYRK